MVSYPALSIRPLGFHQLFKKPLRANVPPTRVTVVNPPAPLVYAPQLSAARLSLPARLLALAISLASLGVLCFAAKIEPSPTGIGTHRQMGLQPCAFERRTGLPCVTCGMTTSFAHFARGQFLASFYVQPMGMILAVMTAMSFWAALYIALSGRPAYQLFGFLPTRYYVIPFVSLTILAWVWKIWIHVNGRDGWG